MFTRWLIPFAPSITGQGKLNSEGGHQRSEGTLQSRNWESSTLKSRNGTADYELRDAGTQGRRDSRTTSRAKQKVESKQDRRPLTTDHGTTDHWPLAKAESKNHNQSKSGEQNKIKGRATRQELGRGGVGGAPVERIRETIFAVSARSRS
jgi:hypothetical protein